ncbi:hypothetical protein KKE26_08560, partial [bacterium]|nr:hypothetical protein [bacterium]
MIVAAGLVPADTQRATARVAATKNPIRKHVPCSCRACPCLDQLIGNHKGCSYKSIQMIVAAGLVPADTQRATARVAATKNPIRKHVP